eukprot:SAG22_NODE_4026_length_1417_cov_1.687405_1_plen_62_part_00
MLALCERTSNILDPFGRYGVKTAEDAQTIADAVKSKGGLIELSTELADLLHAVEKEHGLTV